MNKFVLAALVGGLGASAIEYTAVDDPRCHDEPSRIVLEPTPGPTDLPPPPGQMRVFDGTSSPTTSPTPAPPACLIDTLQVIDLEDSSAAPIPLHNGAKVALSALPAKFTVEAVPGDGSVTKVKFLLDGTQVAEDTSSPFLISEDEFKALYIPNTSGSSYKLAAYGADASGYEPLDDDCVVEIAVEYGNPYECEGLITHFSLFDTIKQAKVPGFEILKDGQTLLLEDLPDYLTIVANTNGRDDGSAVHFEYNGDANYHTATGKVYSISGASALIERFNVGGEAITDEDGLEWGADPKMGASNDGRVHDACNGVTDNVYCSNRWFPSGTTGIYDVDVPASGDYLVRLHFQESYFNGEGKRVFDVYVEDQLVMDDFDIFKDAGGKHNAFVFEHKATVTDGTLKVKLVHQVENPKISGIEVLFAGNEASEASGLTLKETEFMPLRESGKHTIKAWSVDANGNPEGVKCEASLNVDSDWGCLQGLVSGFTLIDASNPDMTMPVPGFEFFTGNRMIDLAEMPEYMAIEVHITDEARGVRFYWNTTDKEKDREENSAPFASNGDYLRRSFPIFNPDSTLSKMGTHTLYAVGRYKSNGKFEDKNQACMMNLTITDSRVVPDPTPPETIVRLEQFNHTLCAPAYAKPDTDGQRVFFQPLVEVQEIKTNDTVHFKTVQFIKNSTMDWVTTSFVTKSGVEVCDRVDNVDFEKDTGHVYEAKCYNGFAYASVYAYSSEFSDDEASADTSMLPLACRNALPGKVVKYTFVFTCDCENVPDIPTEITKNDDEPPVCIGPTGNVWGDPHIVTFDDSGDWGYGCQGVGEFVISKATLEGYDYDFEVRGKFSKWELNEDFSWSTGIVVQQDVKVQLSMSEEPKSWSNYFDEVPVNFYVNDEPRLLADGSGDHRVIVSVHSFAVDFYFVSSGISVRTLVRPHSVSSHIRDVPGSLTTYVCYPEDNPNIKNVMGLLGTPTGTRDDDFMDAMGNTISLGNSYKYCTTNWCIDDEAESLMKYEDGYDFSYYNKCHEPEFTKKRALEEIDPASLPEAVQNECARVNNTFACLFDAFNMLQAFGEEASLQAAEEAVDTIMGIRQAKEAYLTSGPDEARCCSRDFKNCATDLGDINTEGSCGYSQYNCNECGFVWLKKGTLDDGPLANCAALGAACDASYDYECCPGMACQSGTCAAVSGTNRRELKDKKFVRPDLPEHRNIVVLSDLM